MSNKSQNNISQNKNVPAISVESMTKTYTMGETQVHALKDVSLRIDEGDYVAIIGTSGSGKSTLMNMIGLLDKPTSGTYHIRGVETSQLGQTQMADLRNSEIGFVFQRFNLLPRTSARQQVELPLFYAGVPAGKASKMAIDALEKVGLGERSHHRPDELSGGQQQRVAIARALVNSPTILLADEPTGALDTKTGEEVMALFEDLHSQGMTLILVTHDNEIAAQAARVITLKDGEVISDKRNDQSNEQSNDESDRGSTQESESLPTEWVQAEQPDEQLIAQPDLAGLFSSTT